MQAHRIKALTGTPKHRCPEALVCLANLQPAASTSGRSSGMSTVTSKSPKLHDVFLGRAGVPPLGMGLAALGRPGYINLGHDQDLSGKDVEDLRANCYAVLDAAWAAGIRYYDAARSYGRAEEFLAGWLTARDITPEQVTVGSKWGYTYTAAWRIDTGGCPHEVKEHTSANFIKQSAESEALLGPWLRLYQIHSATIESGVLERGDVLAVLEGAKKQQGLAMGLSLSGVAQADALRRALSVRMSCGGRLFDSVQATWNLLEQSAGPALAEASAAGLCVVVKEALANGRLTPRNSTPGMTARLQALAALADKHGVSMDALALAAVMAQPWSPMVLSGAATPDQLRANADALRVVHALSPDELAALAGCMVQPPADYWAERGALAWN